ncbi:thiol:disulfide interchange protein DsbA/DsbL [Vibrio hangzhouensis]|uniref:Protein-disulfide isomerase n=1 Tax=Vibrio hangzhouensis TaxID=462991 RepID=A0A1H5S1I3_9VIBR|nr:thiol:disulfide interchange protein DsbA/DsbL [Vibrio hangzhouensis]SEF44472.1 Protein-disulfide isomerase [Vibrio hangzhouensis]
MFKTLSKTLSVLAFALVVSACSDTDAPVEGKQYRTLETNLSSYRLPQVTEVFSLGCGHCRNLEPMLPNLEKLTDSKLGKVHVMFNESAQIAAMIFYSAVMQAENNQVPADMKDELFALIQNHDMDGNAKKTELDRIFESRGMVSPYELNEEQQKSLFDYLQLAESVSSAAKINAVPTFIVNGKYEVILGGHQDINEIAETINYLKSKEQ